MPDPARVERSFRRARELDPDEVDFNERLGAALLSRVQPLVNAASAAEEKKDMTRAGAAFDRAEPLLYEARGFHQQAADLYPRSYRSWMNLGVSERWLGDAQAFHTRVAMARNDTLEASRSALAALLFYQDSAQEYQESLQINPELEDSKRSINQLFRAIMALPGLDPAIVEFQRRADQDARNRNQGRR